MSCTTLGAGYKMNETYELQGGYNFMLIQILKTDVYNTFSMPGTEREVQSAMRSRSKDR